MPYDNKMDEYLAEALDRTHMVSSHLQMALDEHPVLDAFPDVRVAYQESIEKIESLYQLIGHKEP